MISSRLGPVFLKPLRGSIQAAYDSHPRKFVSDMIRNYDVILKDLSPEITSQNSPGSSDSLQYYYNNSIPNIAFSSMDVGSDLPSNNIRSSFNGIEIDQQDPQHRKGFDQINFGNLKSGINFLADKFKAKTNPQEKIPIDSNKNLLKSNNGSIDKHQNPQTHEAKTESPKGLNLKFPGDTFANSDSQPGNQSITDNKVPLSSNHGANLKVEDAGDAEDDSQIKAKPQISRKPSFDEVSVDSLLLSNEGHNGHDSSDMDFFLHDDGEDELDFNIDEDENAEDVKK
ncbi:hypothetical protein AYI68_g4495 [Smittium mucronatum]|uniref:Uncharacterized protein n=1 Tax=Smittium mucronatum TaxID=133383 RepID=A0A1R0GWX5_9FUNG|nr:hypothetical protein AYI68_g4495 [Smittium mucronatum]